MEKEPLSLTEKLNKGLLVEKTGLLNMEQSVSLFRTAYNGKPPWYDFYTPEKARKLFSSYQKKESFQAFIAKIDTITTGIAIVTKGNSPDSLFLQEIFVDPNYQQSSYRIGSKLLETIIEYTKNKGYKTLQLQTDSRNEPACRLYKKFGFTEKQDLQEKRVTQRTFTKTMDSPDPESKPTAPLPKIPEDIKGFNIFLNQRELCGYLFAQNTKPENDEDQTLFQGAITSIIQNAIKNDLVNKMYYSKENNSWSKEGETGILYLSETILTKLSQIAGFILSIQRLNIGKITGSDMDTIVERCFELKDPDKRLNVVCFVCASYNPNFNGVSEDARSNRLKFFLKDIKKLEKAIEVFNGKIKLTFLFSDTDYEIYPIDKSEENLAKFQKQYEELRDYCRQNFNPRLIRIIPWSRFQRKYSDIYSLNLQQALPLSQEFVNRDYYLPKDQKESRIKQAAVYAAQAATLPNNSVLLIMEPKKFNKDYDLLFERGKTIPKIPKLEIFDVDSYKAWTNRKSLRG